MRNDKRYKPSPLQIWRAQYRYITEQIRLGKISVKHARWNKDRPNRHRDVAVMRAMASRLMKARATYQAAAQTLWESHRQPPRSE